MWHCYQRTVNCLEVIVLHFDALFGIQSTPEDLLWSKNYAAFGKIGI